MCFFGRNQAPNHSGNTVFQHGHCQLIALEIQLNVTGFWLLGETAIEYRRNFSNPMLWVEDVLTFLNI